MFNGLVHMSVCVRACKYVCLFIYECWSVYVPIKCARVSFTCAQVLCVYERGCVSSCVCECACVCVCVCMCVSVCVCVCVCVCECVCVCVCVCFV